MCTVQPALIWLFCHQSCGMTCALAMLTAPGDHVGWDVFGHVVLTKTTAAHLPLTADESFMTHSDSYRVCMCLSTTLYWGTREAAYGLITKEADIWNCFCLLSSACDAVNSQPLYHKLKIQYYLARWVHCLFTAWSMGMWCHLVKNLLCATNNCMVYMHAFELCMKVVLMWAGFQGH